MWIEFSKRDLVILSGRRDIHMAYWYSKYQNSFLWLEFSGRSLVILASVLIGFSLVPLWEDAYPPVVWTTMFVLWHVFVNSEDIYSFPYSLTIMNATFLSWSLNVVTRNFGMSIGGRLIMDGNPKGCELEEHIATKFKVNPRIISTSKNEKSIWSMNPGANFWYISGWNYGDFSCLGNEIDRAGIFQFRDIFWGNFYESFYCH